MRRNHSGFTLIEVMMVVAIIGILASVALPSLSKMQLRSKQAERRLIIASIERATDDAWTRDGRYPEVVGDASTLLGTYNPAFPPTTMKRPFIETMDGWKSLNLKIDGGVYYSYFVAAVALGTGDRDMIVYAYGDLDGDGNDACYVYHRRRWSGVVLTADDLHDEAAVAGPSFECF